MYWLRDAPEVAQDGGGAGGGAGDRASGGGGDRSPTSWPEAMVSVSWGRGLAAAVAAVGTFCLYSFLRAPPMGCVGESVNLLGLDINAQLLSNSTYLTLGCLTRIGTDC